MSKRVTSCVQEHFQEKACPTLDAGRNPVFRPKMRQCKDAACVGLLATAIMLGTNYATPAADDCLAGPTRPPARGGHWYFHLDHADNRKCWYLVEPAAQTATAEAPQPQASPEATPQPTFGSFFSTLSTGLPGATTATQPDGANGDARVPAAHPDDLKNDEAAPGRQPRMAPPDPQAALAPKPHRPAHARTPAEHADERAAPQLNQAERDALFEEFLRWRDRR